MYYWERSQSSSLGGIMDYADFYTHLKGVLAYLIKEDQLEVASQVLHGVEKSLNTEDFTSLVKELYCK